MQLGFTRFKHWFQIERRNKRFVGPLGKKLAIAIVRNPYDNLRGIYNEPFHAAYHGDMKFTAFLNTTWTLPHRCV